MVRPHNAPDRIIPHFGQIPENPVDSPVKESWDILHEDVGRSHLTDNSCHFTPQPGAGAGDSGAFADEGDVLAGEAPGNAVHQASPGLAIEGCDIRKDGKPGEDTVRLPLDEDLLAIGIDFDGPDGLVAEEQVAENPATSPCK